MKTKIFTFIIIISFLLLVTTSVKAQEVNETRLALEEARRGVEEAKASNLSTSRVNDILVVAEQLFEAQSALEAMKGRADYSVVTGKIDEIESLLKKQLEMYDEVTALEKRMADVGTESRAYPLLEKVKKEFEDERYEKITDLIEEAYIALSEERAVETKVRAFYEAGTKTITGFFKKRWKETAIAIISIIIIYLLTHKKIRVLLIDKKIKDLSMERKILEDLIKKAQDEYFRYFKIPEDLYYIRITKFGELIRDIERQTPVLIEEKEKLIGGVEEEKIPLKQRVINKIYAVHSALRKLLEKEGVKPEVIIPEEIGIKYGFNRRTISLLIRNTSSYSSLRSVIKNMIKQRAEERKRRLIEKRRKEEESARKREEEKRMDELLRLSKEREKETAWVERKEKFIRMKISFFEKLRSLFFLKERIRAVKERKEVLKRLKKEEEKRMEQLYKEKSTKEEEYIQFLLKERLKPAIKKEEKERGKKAEPAKKPGLTTKRIGKEGP